MDAETRKTLEALANDANDLCTTTMDERAAIRAALAEVDALTQQVATLTAERDHARAKWDGYETERERECVELRAQVADLEARALNAEMEASIFREDFTGAVAALRGDPQPKGMTDAGLGVFYDIEDMRNRALPKNACLHLANGMTIEEDEGVFLVWTRDDKRATTDPLPTLSAALSAAKEAP